MTKKILSTVAGASLVVILFNIIGRGLGFVREVVFAGTFGLQKEFDIYLIGAVLPIVINSIILYFGQNYFIPLYHKERAAGVENGISVSDHSIESAAIQSNTRAIRFLHNSLFGFGIASLLLTIILFAAAPLFIRFYFPAGEEVLRQTAVNVLRIFLLSIPFQALYSVLAAYMQAEFEFRYPAIASLFLNAAIILLVAFFSGSIGVNAIPIGYSVGSVFQVLFLFLIAYPSISKVPFRFPKTDEWKKTGESVLWVTLLIEVVGQLYVLVDRAFSGSIQEGGFAALNYATTLFSLPNLIISLSFSSVLFSRFAQSYHNDKQLFSDQISRGLSVSSFLFIPISVMFIFRGGFFVSLVYERGKFDPSATAMTGDLLALLSVSLVFYSMYSILNKAVYAIGAAKQLLFLSIGMLILKIAGSTIFVSEFLQNGLAAVTSLSYIGLAAGSFLILIWKGGIPKSGDSFRAVWKEFCISVLNAGFAVFLASFFAGNFLNSFGTKQIGFLVLFVLLYGINSLLLKQSAALSVVVFIKSVVNKKKST